jgi:glycosyltransferase involved in cell wall biosynthesis
MKTVFLGPYNIFSSPSRSTGGIESSTRSFVSVLNKLPKSYLISFDFIPKQQIIRRNGIIHVVIPEPNKLTLLFTFYLYKSFLLYILLLKIRPQRIIAQGISYFTKASLLYSIKNTFLIVHGIMYREYMPLKFVEWFSIKSIKWFFISVDELFTNYFSRNIIYINKDIKKIYRKKNLYELSNFLPDDKYDNLKIRDYTRKNRFIFIGNIIPRKRPIDLVKAFNETGLSDWELLIVGKDKGDKYSENLRHAISETENCFWETNADDKMLIKLLLQSKIFCLVSSSESLPISIIEAQTAGCYVVASDVGGINELVIKNTGILINNIEDLPNALIMSVNNYKLPEVQSCINKISINYSSNLVTKKLSKILQL